MTDEWRIQEPEPWRYAAYAEGCWCVRCHEPCELHAWWQDGFDAREVWGEIDPEIRAEVMRLMQDRKATDD